MGILLGAALGFAAIQVATAARRASAAWIHERDAGIRRDCRRLAGDLLGSLIDLQFGDRLYYPTSALDNSVRTAFVNSISTTGIPPQNPFFQPAQPVLCGITTSG